MKINATTARRSYFENHVEFECLIQEIHRNIFERSGFEHRTTTNQSEAKSFTLADKIRKIASSGFFPMLQTRASALSECKNNRNWLAHTCQQQLVKTKQIASFKKTKTINVKLKKALVKIKERHPRSGRANIQ